MGKPKKGINIPDPTESAAVPIRPSKPSYQRTVRIVGLVGFLLPLMACLLRPIRPQRASCGCRYGFGDWPLLFSSWPCAGHSTTVYMKTRTPYDPDGRRNARLLLTLPMWMASTSVMPVSHATTRFSSGDDYAVARIGLV